MIFIFHNLLQTPLLEFNFLVVRESVLSSYLQSIDNVKLRQGMYKRLQELFQKKVFHIVISERVISR